MLIQTVVPHVALHFLPVSDVYQQYHGTNCMFNQMPVQWVWKNII